MSLQHPWLLLLLLVLPLLWWRWSLRGRRSAVTFSSLQPVAEIVPSWAVRWRWIPAAIRTVAIALLIIALAGPRRGDEHTRINTEGIAIQIIVDRSGSMRATDFTINGKPTDRLEVVKHVVERFVRGGEGLPGRPDDMIGMIAFATFADTLAPITSDHTHLIHALQQMTIASERDESATAIGDAIALGVERLRSLEQRVATGRLSSIKSKVIILLTDGENNAGDIDPITAANMAAAFGIKVYTIGASSNAAFASVPGRDMFGQPLRIPVAIDEDMMTEIATITGGHYYRATDTDTLTRIYRQIDELEKTKMHERRYVTYKHAAVEPLRLGPLTMPPLLMLALGMLFAETLLRCTRFRAL
jgi:Ca-activated chloride channel homolog